MIELICRRGFFDFEFPLRQLKRAPRLDGSLRGWTQAHRLPALVEIEGVEPFADVYAGWDADGLAFAFDVRGHSGPPRCDTQHWWKQDGLRVCVDTRGQRDVRRGTRYSHFFYFLPVGGGSRRREPVAGVHKLNRARETPPATDITRLRCAVSLRDRGYVLEASIPGACLNGWDPVDHRRIGLFYKVKDAELPAQHLNGDDEVGWNADPSTWATAVLVD